MSHLDRQVHAEEVMCLYNPIMQSINAKLDVITERNQITGKEAGQLYLHALETALHEVVLLLLGADQRKLILAQTGKENAGANLIVQQTENAALEALNIPKEGKKIDQETLKLKGETGLIPKQSQLMDAQIVHLLRENDKLEAEKRVITLQGDNLIKEGDNLDKQGDLITAQIEDKQNDAAVKAMEVKVKGTQAEANRRQALLLAAQEAAMRGDALAKILSIMVSSYNMAIQHQPDIPSAFDRSSINSLASKAIASAMDFKTITYFTDNSLGGGGMYIP